MGKRSISKLSLLTGMPRKAAKAGKSEFRMTAMASSLGSSCSQLFLRDPHTTSSRNSSLGGRLKREKTSKVKQKPHTAPALGASSACMELLAKSP